MKSTYFAKIRSGLGFLAALLLIVSAYPPAHAQDDASAAAEKAQEQVDDQKAQLDAAHDRIGEQEAAQKETTQSVDDLQKQVEAQQQQLEQQQQEMAQQQGAQGTTIEGM